MKRLCSILVLLTMVVCHAFGQVLTGVVLDKESGDALAGVRVCYSDDEQTAVVTNAKGQFTVLQRNGNLVFSMVGYDTQTQSVDGVSQMTVRLVPAAKALNEVEVSKKRQKYSRKNNPAVEMMRKVIAAKKSSDMHSRDYFRYVKYEKMTLAINEFTEKVFEDDHFKRMPFLKDHVEVCPETGKLILPLTVDEKVSQKIYRKNPSTEKTIVIGQRHEGVTELAQSGDIVTTMMEDCFTDVDIYQDDVRLLQYQFTSPISSTGAIRFYRYFIVDTLMVDREKCYQLDFTPNNQQDFGFSGSLYVLADSTWRVKRCILNVPPRTDINFVDHMDIIQDFQSLESGEQVVTNNKMILQLKIASFIQKFQVERVVKYSDFDFTPIADHSFKFKGDTKVESSSQMRDEAFWDAHRATPLTKSESHMDVFMQRLENIKGFKYIAWVAKAFIEGYVETNTDPKKGSKFDFGHVDTFLGANWVEGFHLRVGGQSTAKLNPHWFFKGYAKYAFGDQRWKGMGEVTYSFNAKDYLPREYPIRSLTFTYQNDIISPSDKYVPTDKDNVFVAWKWKPVRHMAYFERFNLLYDWEVENGLRFTVQARREWNEGAGHLFYQRLSEGTIGQDENGTPFCTPNQENVIQHRRITFTEATFGIKYQPGATYINTKQRRLQTNYDSPIMGLNHTIGMKGVLGGQYRYNYTEATLYKRFWLNSWGKIDCTLKGGFQWNKVPYPFLSMPAANMSYIIQDYTFNLIDNMEFLNDRSVSMIMSWDLNGKILNRIPGIKKLKWREYIGCNMLWGMLTDKNNPFLAKNVGDQTLFFFPGSFKDGSFQYQSHVMDKRKPYVELIVGIHNIFKLIHVEYVHRMNYIYPGTQTWGIRILFRASF